MGKYIVTDLTRFSNPDMVCTAVIDMDTGDCLRPMPYFESSTVEKLNMHPGAILEGNITLNSGAEKPHIEDASWSDLNYTGAASGDEFRTILDESLSDSVESGFDIALVENQKHIPVGVHAQCSIVTIKLLPAALSIHEDQYKPGKIRASFTDAEGHYFSYLSITDRGFFDYAKQHQNDGQLRNVRQFVQSQEELYLRVGLSRQYQNPNDGRNGYWLQVNGIYTFPNFYQEIRKY
ncbi:MULTISPECIES: dual OB domain-containing protein [unclassified Nitrospina]|uniref:dual OB domain-containing protein n=1 Tax=unclassified Nitrospina TaxID=2638683 RepID=UPI003F96FAE4